MTIINSENNQKILNNLKENLGYNNLVNQLGIIIKHIDTYNKIVKTHILQLKHVIALDNHNNKSIDSINLAPIVMQLINIFETLQDDDLEKLEELYFTACNWQNEKIQTNMVENKVSDLA